MSNPIDCRCGKFKNEQLKGESITQRDEKLGKKTNLFVDLTVYRTSTAPSCCFIWVIVLSSEQKHSKKNQPRLGVFVIEHVVVRKKKCETSERNNRKTLAALLRELKVCGWEKTHRITRATAWAMENLLSTMRRLWQHDRKFNFKWNFQSKSNEECLLVSMAQDDSFRSEAQERKFLENFRKFHQKFF